MDLDWEREEPRDNVIAGTVGAFLGALIGVALIVLVTQLGYVAAICGAVMAVCSMKGYAMLGGQLSKRGAVISGVMVVAMTYIANRFCFAIAVMEAFSDMSGIDFFTAYRSVGVFLQDGEVKRAYLGDLVMLYLFTLLGGIPVIISALREPAARKAAQEADRDITADLEKAQSALQAEFYPFKKAWMRPLRLSVGIPALAVMAVAIGGWLVSAALWQAHMDYWLAIGGFISAIVIFLMAIPTISLCNTYNLLYVRAGGKLWQVNLQRFGSLQDWEKLGASGQTALKYDILQEIQLVLEGKTADPGTIFHEAFPDFPQKQSSGVRISYGDQRADLGRRARLGAVTPLEDLRVEKETKWSWKVSYEMDTGRRKKLTIPKGHPGFCPASDLEQPQGPVPCRWSAIPVALLTAAVIMGLCYAAGRALDGWEPTRQPDDPDTQTGMQQEAQPEPEVKSILPRIPESVTEYEMSEVCFQVDAAFQYSQRTFLDSETGTTYRVYVQYGVDASDAWDTLSQYISRYRTSPLYDRFDAVYLDTEPLVQMDETSRYNILSVYLTDGEVLHTAVVLSDSGTMFTMEARQDSAGQDVEKVLANLMYTLESVRFEGPEVTEENYQTQIHISETRECTYTAAAYIKTDLFGHDAFVDVYVPYSESPVYSAGGKAIQTEEHGLRVYATVLPGENAKDVIDGQQQALAEAGRVYEEGVDDEVYREDMDAACKLTVYEEDGQTRYAVLYADAKWDGYYLLREITGLPEMVDEEYLPALEELEEIIGLTIPTLEALGE